MAVQFTATGVNEWALVSAKRSQSLTKTGFTESVISASSLYAAKLLGYSELKELQMQVIVAFVMGKDVFAILPTGYGKSLCYACLPILLDDLYRDSVRKSIVVIVMPLTAIMEDQASLS